MNEYQRPWWLWVNKPGRWVTTIRQETTPEGQVYTIRSEPLLQGLTWLIWGPISAVVVVATLTFLAILLEVKDQAILVKALFVLAFLVFPALAWGAAIVISNRLAGRYIKAEREAEARECEIRVSPAQAKLYYQTPRSSEASVFPFDHIRAVKITEPIGVRDGSSVCLTLETEQGKVILLDESLGTEAQKYDLAREMQDALQRHAATRKPYRS